VIGGKQPFKTNIMKEIKEIITKGERWKALTLYNKRDERIDKLTSSEYLMFMLLVDMARESL
jgi:hypothetical protein